MASPQSQALSDLYREWARRQVAEAPMPMDVMREMFSHWGDVTAEPGGVDYVEVDIDGMLGMWATPKGARTDKVILCAHGGGYVAGSIYTHRKAYAHVAKQVGCRALLVEYGLCPENAHPAPVNDMARAYRWLIEREGIRPSDIALIGDSAGGSLALTTISAIRDAGLPLPATTVSLSPWAGGDTSGASYETNKDNDVLVTREMSAAIGGIFLGDADPSDPLANPLYIDYAGYPPTYIQVGGHEAVLNDSTRPADSARQAGVDVRIDVFPEMQHCFQLMAGAAPEADDAVARIADWLRTHLKIDDKHNAATAA
ncbi:MULTISPECIES: alpha/beta hydrolase [unclassified Sphingomonas]|uniref:alpha/beta hydrolase n=1 Tax=unclassified Sphingomonas TaxID=196159 RepID=UPI000A74F60F|nr:MULTISPECIES: alpha/beta hydrolase [unclassified Sphingomonas]